MDNKTIEAIKDVVDQIEMEYGENSETKIIKHFLSQPLRNCDVGTAEEQYQRWDKYCNSSGTECDKCGLNCNVRFDLTAKCFACWSQMPYEKGE